jgi:hypothetical protein
VFTRTRLNIGIDVQAANPHVVKWWEADTESWTRWERLRVTLLTVARTASRVSIVLVTLFVCGCSGSRPSAHPPRTQNLKKVGLRFVSAPAALRAECRTTAGAAGYPVPCPMRVPQGLGAYGSRPGCGIDIVSPGGDCASAWRGWVIGSAVAQGQHLVITASPIPLSNYAKVVNGPGWYSAARVRPLTWVTINGWRMRVVFVPPATNDGSAFANHVVLVWTVGKHTYGVGFHDLAGLHNALLLDEQLARHIRLVGP